MGGMIATLGEAHDLGWMLKVYCRWGKREGSTLFAAAWSTEFQILLNTR